MTSPGNDWIRLEQSELQVTALHASDVSAMMALEHTGTRHPWTEGQYLTCSGREYGFHGAWYGDALVGFVVDWHLLDEAHLMNLCVHGQFQGQGVGRYLLRYWLASMQRVGMATLTLEVRETNETAQRLYASEGFEHVATRPGYYPALEDTEAAHIMALKLASVRASGG
ncbi:ribosomal protein S18-alanine N-acetyltransferase [Salicola sp. Rm-C-2C1-2]|uniref:ribosomal protein S18-alanine N-acetyltransferase n=1 Tax=Salicola sp. Rm-C-2C1-2 TaxID=3141321 RepID=UPI0032E49CDF